MVDSLKIYRSYYEAIKQLPTIIEQGDMWDAIMEYGFNGKERTFTGMSKIVWTLIKPNLDASVLSYNTGKNGGLISGKTRGVQKGGSEGGYRRNKDNDRDKEEKDFLSIGAAAPHSQNGNTFPLPPSGKKNITMEECIALIQIPYKKRTDIQNGQVYEFTTSHPDFDSDKYKPAGRDL